MKITMTRGSKETTNVDSKMRTFEPTSRTYTLYIEDGHVPTPEEIGLAFAHFRPRLNPVPPEMRQKIVVNKRTHRIAFEAETEESVTIVIVPK